MTNRERFIGLMEYSTIDRIPNYEVGVWEQTKDRWETEGMNIRDYHWDWFTGDEKLGMDLREYITINYDMLPPFPEEILEEDEEYQIIRHENGVVTKALKSGSSGGMRSSMDQYLQFPVTDRKDFRELKKRYNAELASRYPAGWRNFRLPGWKRREHVLVLGENCSTLGFYWRAREWMGTENVSYGWYDQPELMHEMMEFVADFTIAVSKEILTHVSPDYVFINEDMSMKNGPLLSPDTYRTFIFPHMKRLTDFFKSMGVRYIAVDTDGNCEDLIPLMMDAGVDAIWPLERAAGMDPAELRRKFGRGLRLWGGVDKRELAKTPEAIEEHLKSLVPVAEDGGYIPTVDHLVPPDVPLENFLYYMKRKQSLLNGRF